MQADYIRFALCMLKLMIIGNRFSPPRQRITVGEATEKIRDLYDKLNRIIHNFWSEVHPIYTINTQRMEGSDSRGLEAMGKELGLDLNVV